MAVVTDTTTLHDGERNVIVKATCHGAAGTDIETDVVKIDLSALAASTGGDKVAPTHLVVDKIEYSVHGYAYVLLEFKATTNDQIAILEGQGCIEFPGGLVDPQSTGSTGDILLTTVDGSSSDEDSYTVVIYARKKYD